MLLLFLGLLPWNTHGLGPMNANLVLIPIYYWTLYRPRLMTVWSVAALGLISDFLLGTFRTVPIIGSRSFRVRLAAPSETRWLRLDQAATNPGRR